MRSTNLPATTAPLLLLLFLILLQTAAAASELKILVSNDDGWAEAGIRALSNHLRSQGHSTIIAAPADNKSGTGSSDARPIPREEACQWNTCPANGPPMGTNESDRTINYINSYPITSVRFGLDKVAPRFLGSMPDVVVTGINVGSNTGTVVLDSGTVNAAAFAARQGYPAFAFSGDSGKHTPWNKSPQPHHLAVYAELAGRVIELMRHDGPFNLYMPEGTFLNINFSPSKPDQCASAADFTVVFTRIQHGLAAVTSDFLWDCLCGDGVVPTETEVMEAAGCHVSLSIGMSEGLDDAPKEVQKALYEWLWLNELVGCVAGSNFKENKLGCGY